MKKRKLRLFLLFSVALNFFFFGGLPFIAKKKFEERQFRPFPASIAWVVRGLDRKDLPTFLERHSGRIAEQQPIGNALLRRLNASQNLAYELIAAEPFDLRALTDTFATIRETNLEYQKVSHDLVADLLEEIEPENRKIIAKYLATALNPKPTKRTESRNLEHSTLGPTGQPRQPQAPNLLR